MSTWGSILWGSGLWGGGGSSTTTATTAAPFVEEFAARQTCSLYFIYQECAHILLEDGGFQLGVIADEEFYKIAYEMIADFLTKTTIIKKVFNVPVVVGVSQYTEPEMMGQIDEALVGQTHIDPTSGYYLDNTNPAWPNEFDAPRYYHEDEIPVKTVQLSPTPNVEGGLTYTYDQGYGVIADITSPVDFTFEAHPSTPGFGVVAEATGNPYLEAAGPGLGVYADLVCSTGNLTMVANVVPAAAHYIKLIPASFSCYLKYGILAHIFSTNSELKDEQKSAYCQARYAEGVNMANAIMSNIYTEEGSNAG